MKFKIDENLPIEAAITLCDPGFDAETVPDEHLTGADDHVVAARVRTEGRVQVTLDPNRIGHFLQLHGTPSSQ